MRSQRMKAVLAVAGLCALAAALMSVFTIAKPADKQRDKLQNRIEQMIVWELSDVMELSPEKEDKFIDVMRRHFKQKRDLTEKQFEIMDRLKSLYKNKNTTDAQLMGALGDLEKNFDQQIGIQKSLHGELKKLLAARELARFAIEWPRVQERVRGKIDKKMDNKPKR